MANSSQTSLRDTRTQKNEGAATGGLTAGFTKGERGVLKIIKGQAGMLSASSASTCLFATVRQLQKTLFNTRHPKRTNACECEFDDDVPIVKKKRFIAIPTRPVPLGDVRHEEPQSDRRRTMCSQWRFVDKVRQCTGDPGMSLLQAMIDWRAVAICQGRCRFSLWKGPG